MLCTLIGAIILSINIQVGLNMHLCDDIGDASSSLRGSTSSLTIYLNVFFCLKIYFDIISCLNLYLDIIFDLNMFRYYLPFKYIYIYIYIYLHS